MNKEINEAVVKKQNRSEDFLNLIFTEHLQDLDIAHQRAFCIAFTYNGEKFIGIAQIAQTLHESQSSVGSKLRQIYEKISTIPDSPLFGYTKNNDKAQMVYYWLWNDLWPEYEKKLTLPPQPVTLERCWTQLKKKKTPGKTIEILKKEDIKESGVRPVKEKLPKGSCFQFSVNLDSQDPRHLILLEREPNGTVVCLCPSEYAPNTQCNTENIVPQYPPSAEEFFEASGEGIEQIIGIITENLLPLHWLEESKQEAKELELQDLQQLLSELEQNPPYQVYFTEFLII